MNNYLILVKHALPEIVETVPAHEWKLSEDGKSRAEVLAHQLIPYHPQILITSTEPKAIETADIIGKRLQLPVHLGQNLYEHDRRGSAFLSKEKFEELIQEFFAKPDALIYGSETADQAHQRFSEALYSILNTHENKTLVVVAHGTVISLFVSRLTGTSAFELWKELGLPSFVVLDMNSKLLVSKVNTL
jgi:broad specificity phosphatase PhoE